MDWVLCKGCVFAEDHDCESCEMYVGGCYLGEPIEEEDE